MPDFPLGFVGRFNIHAAAARDKGWLVVQGQDHAWYLRADTDAEVAAVTAFLNKFDVLGLERSQVRARIKAEARRRLDQLGTVEDKLLLLARAVSLLDKKEQSWSPGEAAEAAHARRELRKISAIHAAAEQIGREDIMVFDTTDDLLAFDPSASSRWDEHLSAVPP